MSQTNAMEKLVLVVLWALSLSKGSQSLLERYVPRSLEETTLDSSSGFCSTWGNGAFRTFDDKFYHFTSTCNHVLSRHCTSGGEDFNIQIHRGSNGNLERIYIKIEGVIILLVNGTISVQDVKISLPYHDKVIGVYKSGIYTKISNRKHTISVVWNRADALWVTLDDKYKGQLCGLCGTFDKNSSSKYDSAFIDENKLDVLGQACYSEHHSSKSCKAISQCEAISSNFLSCITNELIGQYWQMCQADVCSCKGAGCKCASFAEIARHCDKETFNTWKHWRAQTKCAEPACPENQIYKECGPASIPTCTDPNPQQSDHCVNTCVCPEGKVLDNIGGTNRCILETACPCEYSGTIYQPGEMRNTSCQSCVCKKGKWSCSYRSCPGRCTIEEATYFTTFDNTFYSMIGDCSYYAVLTEDWNIKVEIHQCQAAFKQPCLQRVILTKNQLNIVFSNEGNVYIGENKIAIPLKTGEIIIFQQSSMFIQVATTFGLKMQVQILPIMQLYISLSKDVKGSTKGLCGTFNDEADDDFLSAQGIVESTPTTFINSWKTDDSCPEPKVPSPCVSSENDKPCANTQVFENDMMACNRTCQSLSKYDYTCRVKDIPVFGCGCPEGKYMDNAGVCIDKSDCPCYFGELVIKKGQSITQNGRTCTCENGQLSCPAIPTTARPGCTNGKVYDDCINVILSKKNNAKTCRRQNLSNKLDSRCVPGCVCAGDLVEDDNGRCIAPEQCPCSYGGESHAAGKTIQKDCNNCLCKAGRWHCTDKRCPKTCQVHGDGQYITFDGKRYMFDGNCEYVLAEDYCSEGKGTFQILTESVPCCENGVTCSRNIKILLVDKEFILKDGKVVRTDKSGQVQCADNSYSLHTVGLYLILTFSNGITVIWDKRTRVSITLDPRWKGKVCGLCGNFNDDVADDLTTKGNSLVTNPVKFGSSWKSSPSCSDTLNQTFPCDRNPYCLSWAQRKCGIIKDVAFLKCHKKVDPTPFYEACIQEACACDLEGKYLGFCTAVAMYAEACNKAGVCVDWRTPELCPVYCDYYNSPGECSWHYRPCGTLTTKTCSDHYIGKKYSAILEGCYAKCPENAPFLDENKLKCVNVSECTCYYNGKILHPGATTRNDCEECKCVNGIVTCVGSTTTTSTTPIETTSTTTIEVPSTTTVKTTPTSTTTYKIEETTTTTMRQTTTTETTQPPVIPTTTTSTTEECDGKWSSWINDQTPSEDSPGDSELLDLIPDELCPSSSDAINKIQCQFADYPERPISESTDNVTCDKDTGLVCVYSESASLDRKFCYDYRIRVCCKPQTTTQRTTTYLPETTSTTTTPETTSLIETTTSTASTTTPTPKVETTTPIVTTTSTVPTSSTTTEEQCNGEWSPWINDQTPSEDSPGDSELLDSMRDELCPSSSDAINKIQCQFADYPERPISESTDNVTCDKDTGLVCVYSESASLDRKFCYDYQIRVCCEPQTTTQRTTTYLPETTSTTTTPETTSLIETTTSTASTTTPTPKVETTTPIVTTTSTVPTSSTTTETTSLIETTTSTASTTTPTPKVETTTPIVTTTSTVPTSSTTTEEQCNGEWSPWINDQTPSEDSPGDSELLDSMRDELCPSSSDAINKIQCQFADYPERPISESTDNVTCDKDTGLVCVYSESASLDRKFCYDYQIRVCCEPQTTTQRTTTYLPETTSTTTTPETTPLIETTTSTASTTTPTPKVETTTPIVTTTSTVPTSSTTTEEQCNGEWSPWINDQTPSEDSPGDSELLDSMRDELCPSSSDAINKIQCQFADYPERPISESTDNVTCDKDTGLVCVYSESASLDRKFCYDYQIRVCCEPQTTTQRTTTYLPETTSTTTTPETTSLIETTTSTASTTTPTPKVETTTPIVTTTSTVPTSSTTTEEQCNGEWSPWINDQTPSEDSPGDSELLDSMRDELCPSSSDAINKIQCQFADYPERPISESTDNVTCDKDTGLVCVYSESASLDRKFCYDYQIRVCCEPQTTTQRTTTYLPETTSTTTTPETTSLIETTTSTASTTTPTPKVETTTPIVTTTSTVPTSSTTTETTSLIETTTSTASTTTPTPKVETTTPIVTTTSTVPTSSTTTEEQCNGEWSPWINDQTPSEDSPGDSELLDSMRDELCPSSSDAINKIQCQFADYPERPISESTDNVTCDKDTGLVCVYSESASLDRKFCYDYQIRVCCEPQTTTQRTTTYLPETTSTTTTPETTPLIETTTSTASTTTPTPKVETMPPIETTTSTTSTAHLILETTTPIVTTTSTVPTSSTTPETTTPIVTTTSTLPTTSTTPETTTPIVTTTTTLPTTSTTPETTTPIVTTTSTLPTTSTTPETTTPIVTTTTTLPTTSTTPETTTPIVTTTSTLPTTSTTPETTTPIVTTTTTLPTTSTTPETTTPIVTTTSTLPTTSTTPETTTPIVTTTTTLPTTSTTPETTTPIVTTTSTLPTTSTTPETTTPIVTTTTTLPTTSTTPESTTKTVTTPTTTPFTTPGSYTTVTTTSQPIWSTTELYCNGVWSRWFNRNIPSIQNKSDSELLEPIRNELCPYSPYQISSINCEAVKFPQRPISETEDNVTCDINRGLICEYNELMPESRLMCLDYRIRVCCEPKLTTLITSTTISPVTSEPPITRRTESTVGPCQCNTNPPRKCMETWRENCRDITCVKGDIFKMDAVSCAPSTKPTCRNNIEPVKVRTANGCCEKWECDCECEVWGDPHYRTFDGLWYDFFEDCTYTLVEERVPKYHFSVLVDNYFCISFIKKSCPKGLIITYNGNVVRISTGGAYVLTVNGSDVSLPYSANGFEITKLGISTYISIPDIRASITAFRNAFKIRVPEEYFLNNTQGQCGSCSHSPPQCVRKNGEVEPSDCCHKTAYDWRVDDPSKPKCQSAPTNESCTSVPPPPTCKPEETICDVIQRKPFEECRKKINLDKYIKTCVFDHCALNATIDCSSLETAALACASVGVCVDWRSFTNGVCNYSCDPGLMYKPCRSKKDNQCTNETMIVGASFSPPEEGCFCPDGLILSEDKSKCIASCQVCRDQLGHRREKGEIWEDDNDPCLSYSCTLYGVVIRNKTCSQDEDCPEYERVYIDRCCFRCERIQAICKVHKFNETIRRGYCKATFEATQCQGFCASASRYDFKKHNMNQYCQCCRESKTEKMPVNLFCKNGKRKTVKYVTIKSCTCQDCENKK
ncbi:mucin-5AC-like [Mustelus asterias]